MYKVEVLTGNSDVTIPQASLQSMLDNYSANGWKLVSCLSSEVRHNATRIGLAGTNATINQIIMIFERPVFNK